jgi:hypothetical protein
MGSMKSWMLGAAIVAGAVGLGATAAQAAEFGIYVGGPAAYVPPCPGPGYVWTAGYMSDGYWVPGRWSFAGYVDRDRFEHRDFYRDRDFDRHDRDFYRDRGRGNDRFRR